VGLRIEVGRVGGGLPMLLGSAQSVGLSHLELLFAA